MAGKRLERVPQRAEALARLSAGLVNRLADELGEGRGKRRDRTPGAVLQPAVDQRLGADEHVEPLDEIRLQTLPGRVGDLHADEVRHPLAETLDHGQRHRVPARLGELVEVEGRRRGGVGGGLEVGEERGLVQQEVRRRDDGDGVRPRCGCVRREGDRIGGRLRPAVHGDSESAATCLDEELARPLSLVGPEQDPFAGRAHGEDAVETPSRQELGERGERLLVERRPAVAERRRGGRERALDHYVNLMLARMSALRIEWDGPVLAVTIARAERRNAFDAALIEELTDAFGAVGDARAVLLAGDGPSFSAGADVEWQRASIDLSFEENVADAMRLYRMLEAVDECPAPVVARVQGYALGGGSGLVACADVVVAAEDAVFGFTEVRLGIIPAVISPFVLRKVAPASARRYFLTGEHFDSETALRIGLVDEVAADLDRDVERVVANLLAGGPEAVRAAKRLARDRPEGSETARIAAERRTSPEGQEGLRAFLEKRTPAWRSESSS
jgi:methylglutaconyl-CoA hydratase